MMEAAEAAITVDAASHNASIPYAGRADRQFQALAGVRLRERAVDALLWPVDRRGALD